MTVATRVISGPDHAPMGGLALWKETLLGLILALAAWEIVTRYTLQRSNVKRFNLDSVDLIILLLLALSLAVTAFTHADWGLYAFGFRYDFIPLIALLVLRRASWSEDFLKNAQNVLLGTGVLVALYGIISAVLPAEFFHWLGYSDLHSLYLPGKPIAAFQQIGGTSLRRIQSTMSGPNQLGIWLLIPLGVAFARLRVTRYALKERKIEGLLLILFGVALLLTFSRAAWIGAAVMFGIAVWPVVRRIKKSVLIGAGVLIFVVAIAGALLFPDVILRVSSTRGHIENPVQAVQTMLRFPLGRGMGMAGPASNRVSDTCVMLNENDDASWAASRPDLCVFLGNTQVQPVDRACACPFLPENWYLQIGVEMGWVGFFLYVALVLLLIQRIIKAMRTTEQKRSAGDSRLMFPFLLFSSLLSSFVGVSIAALFLHAWEDAATAYTLWILAAVVIGLFAKPAKQTPAS